MRSIDSLRLLGAASILVLGTSATALAKGGAEWGYTGDTGPEQWASLSHDYELCGHGAKQSPIDIPKNVNKNKARTPITFDYRPTPLHIKNNGHTVQVDYAPGSTMTVNGAIYNLLQFHFHIPSENTVSGRSYEMEGHLVHAKSNGSLAVVAFMIKQGEHNSAIQAIWDHLPKREGKARIDETHVNAADLLPDNRDYYAYSGSLTTPPCSEGVRWHVLVQPVAVSAEQVVKFGKIFLGGSHFPDGNARPVQPLNNRVVTRVSD